MIFRSRHANYEFIARSEQANYAMGFKNVTHQHLVADFAMDNEIETVRDDMHDYSGAGFAQAVIRGGVFDSIEAQSRLGWSDEERKLVEKRLLDNASAPNEGDFWLYEAPKPVPPWPAYDDMSHQQIPEFAEVAGLLEEALAYESRSKKREGLMKALAERAEKAREAAGMVASS